MALLYKNASSAPTVRPQGENPPKYVQAIKANPDTLNLTVEAYGKVMSQRTIPLSAEVQGELMRGSVPIKNGTQFKKGDVLFKIKSADVEFGIKARRANFIQIFASTLADLKVDFKSSFDTWEGFYHRIDIYSDLPALPNNISQKEKTFLSSRGVLTEYYSIKAEEERVRKYRVVAPFDGTMINVQFEEGSRVNPGSRIVTISQHNKLEVVLPVNTGQILFVKPDAQVELSSENHRLTGYVRRIGQTVDPSTQSINVYVSVEGHSEDSLRLYDGMFLSAKIYGSEALSVIDIPRRALVQDKFVYTLEDSNLVLHPIQVVKYNRNSAIINGVNAGEWVVVEPLTSVGSSKYLPLLD